MATSTRHPQAQARAPQYIQMTDTYGGTDMVKQAGQTYLPATEGMVIDGMNVGQPGFAAYEAYLTRAVYHDFVKEAVRTMVGLMHQEPARIDLPPEMEALRENATNEGESLQLLLRKINEWQLVWGRAGLLVEVPDGQGPTAKPYLVPYGAAAIINWDHGIRAQGAFRLEFVILDETNFERYQDFTWAKVARFRVLAMSDTVKTEQQQDQSPDTSGGVYQVATLEQNETIAENSEWATPSLAGRTMDEIPFVFINTKDTTAEPDDPPLMGLSHLSLAIYRAEADYRQHLYMQTQETLVTIGADTSGSQAKTRIGAGAQIDLPRQSEAYYIGTSGNGLGAMRTALQDDKASASEFTGKMFDGQRGSTYQSGEGLKVRVSAKAATLREIAETSAEALQRALRLMAKWMGADQSKVVVEANTEFVDSVAASQTALELAQAAQMGFPLSQKSMHRFAERNDMTELSFEDEIAEIKSQDPLVPAAAAGPLAGGAAGGLGRATGGAPVKRGV